MPPVQSALSGLRIVDLSTYLPGPYATMLLADLGADVLHVEQLDGDPARHMSDRVGDDSVLHWWVGRNKRSLALDLERPADRLTFLDKVRAADVVVEGFRPGVATRLGVDYRACRAVNSRIVYCAITGYGQEGPDAGAPGHDLNYAARAGMLGLSTDEHGSPVVVGFPLTDIAGGLHAAIGILAAYHYQQQTGLGQFVDISILASSLGLVGMQLMKTLAGKPPTKSRDLNLGAADPAYGLYRCRDGKWLSIACVETKFWRRLCELLDRDDLAAWREDDPVAARRELALTFILRDRADWDSLLKAEEVCYAPVNEPCEVADDARALGMVEHLTGRDGANHPVLVNPITMSLTPPLLRTAAPPLVAPK